MRAVNLLPPDLRSGPKGAAPAVSAGVKDSGRAGAYAIIGVLAVCVAAMASYVLAGNTVKEREAQLAHAAAESAAVTTQVAALKPYADFEAIANARLATVRDLAGSRFDWEQAIRDLSRVVPADVTLGSFVGDLGSAEPGTAAGSGIRGAITAPAITLTGCARSQTKVAALMARLRTIDGVTRVSLSKSDKEATATQAADPTAPSVTGYCGEGGVPSFEVVVFFEGAAAASVAPAPGAAAAAPATTGAAPAAGATPAATPAPAGTAATTPATGTTTSTPPATTP
jgi:Tfp pilus assembly protein PilN